MRVLVALVLVACACSGALGVWIRAGDKSFPLATVKQLRKMVASHGSVGPHLDSSTVRAVCASPLLPQVFRPLCQRDEAGAVFSNLSGAIPAAVGREARYTVDRSPACRMVNSTDCMCLDCGRRGPMQTWGEQTPHAETQKVVTDMDECEICANPACTGCMY